MPAPDAHLHVTVITDENLPPVQVIAADRLMLKMFAGRSVIDFGTATRPGKPIQRYLLVENPEDEDQWVRSRSGNDETTRNLAI